MGTSPVGDAVRDLSKLVESKGCRVVNLFQLVQQLHHCKWKPTSFTSDNFQLTSLQGLVTPPLIQNTGAGAYTFFAVFCLLAFIFTFFCVPETAGKTLEEMDEVFKDISSEAEEQKKTRIMADIVEGNRSAFVPAA